MAQQVINLGTNPNDRTGESLRGGGTIINANFTELYAIQSDTINAGAVAYNFTGATNEQRIALADADAVLLGKSRVRVPASMIPYDITLCPASTGVQRVREGGNDSVYEPEAYGAGGDNVRNDYDNVQACINAAAGRGTVVLNRTSLCSSKITLPSNTELTGLGWFTGLRFDWTPSSGAGSGGAVYIQNSDTTNGNTLIRLRNFRVEGANTSGGPAGNPVPAPAGGLHFRRGSDVIVQGLLIKNIPAIAISHQGISNLRITDNTLTGIGRDGITGGPYGTSPSTDNVISNNTGDSIHDDMIACNASVDTGTPGTTPPARWTINANVMKGGSSLSADNFARGLYISGATDIIAANNIFSDTSQPTMQINADITTGFRNAAITLTGNHCLRAGSVGVDAGQSRAGMRITGTDDLQINGGKVADAAEYGIFLQDIDGFEITGTRVLRCGGTDAVSGFGINLDGATGGPLLVKNGIINGVRVFKSGAAGIYVKQCDILDIMNAKCHNNGQSGSTNSIQSGIVVEGGGTIRLHNNSCTDTQGTKTQTYGIVTTIATTTYLSMKENYLDGNKTDRFFFNSTITNLHVRLEAKVQTLAYGASITPDPRLGEVIEVTLTNNITTINEPPANARAPGVRFTLVFIQNGTGGFTVGGWNAAYKQAWSDTGNTANKRSSITFERDKVNAAWTQVSAQSPYV